MNRWRKIWQSLLKSRSVEKLDLEHTGADGNKYEVNSLYIWIPNQTEGVVNTISIKRAGNGYPNSGTNKF